MLGVDILTYRGEKWFKFSSNTSVLTSEGIYLTHENNFESVICVKHVDRQDCFGLCKVDDVPHKRYFFRGHTNGQDQSTKSVSNSSRNCFSKYLKGKRYLKSNIKYQQNVLDRQKRKENSIRQYKQNVFHRQKVKVLSIEKYCQNVHQRETKANKF